MKVLSVRQLATQCATAAALLMSIPGAWAAGPAVGDLVEIVTGMGPTLAELLVLPDAAGYVTIVLPTGKQIPVNMSKLRLIQAAGAPNAAIASGESVRWKNGGVTENGNLVKVNGQWCQVKTVSSTTIGWVECKALTLASKANSGATKPAAEQAARPAKPHSIKLQGNWENADGTVKLELQVGKKCYVSLGPMTGECVYAKTPEGVTVTFDGEEMIFIANEDGTLSSKGDADAMMSIRLKRK